MMMFRPKLPTMIVANAIALCVLHCPTANAGEGIDLIGVQVSEHWVPKSVDHWTVGSDVVVPPDSPESLQLTPGEGLLLATGETKSRDANMVSKQHFGDMRLEVEFLVPQGSNSGIYVMGRYELQIKDSYGKDKIDSHDCGAIYQRWDDRRGKGKEGFEGHVPQVNACKPPGEWQSFDIDFRAPRFDKSGRKIADAVFISVKQNDVVIHTDVELSGPTRGSIFEAEAATGPILLQGNHGPIAFRKFRVQKRPNAD